MDRFARYWEKLYQAFPDARRQAAQAMGEAVQKDLNAQIQAADLENGAKSTVRSWQDVRIGSAAAMQRFLQPEALPNLGRVKNSTLGEAILSPRSRLPGGWSGDTELRRAAM